LHVNQ